MSDWFTPAEILCYNRGELPDSERAFNRLASASGWRDDPELSQKASKRGGGYLYHISVLPEPIQIRIRLEQDDENKADPVRHPVWARYEKLSNKLKQQCADRLDVLQAVEALARSGMGETAAVRHIARERKIAASTVFNWRSMVSGHARADWLAALAPNYTREKSSRTEVSPEAWDCLKSDYLRPEKPSFSACYRRMVTAAAKNDWQPIPNERSLRRKLDAEVPTEAQTIARDGRDAAKAIFPAQRRSRKHFHAMQAVNMDGHKLDVFVRMRDGTISRLYLIALQDLYSNKFVAWRLSPSENKETVRLVIGDMVEKFGIPEKIFIDNGRAFASKWITGGMKNRYRFKIREEEPQGLLTTLGVEVTWTTPYSGQSKPIERAFRDLCDGIAKHPFCAGAYTGNRPDNQPENYGKTAIDEDLIRDFVDTQIRLHNDQDGRNTENAKNISFNQAFVQSYESPGTIIRWASPAQKSLWLLAADKVRAKRGNGEISFYGNRYWSPALTGHAGKHVTVRFDPDDLTSALRVYDTKDQFICEAALIEDAGFDDVTAARAHAAHRSQFMRLHKQTAEMHQKLTAEELAKIYAGEAPEEPTVKPAVPRLVTNNTKSKKPTPDQPGWDAESEGNFARGLHLVAGNE